MEEPLIEYYGYTGEEDIQEGTDGFDSRCDSDGDGWTDLEHDYTNEDRTYSQRGDDWWLDNRDDVYEMVGALIYRGEGLNWGGDVADFMLERMAFSRADRYRFSCGDLSWPAASSGRRFARRSRPYCGNIRAITLMVHMIHPVRWQTAV